MDIGFIGLGRMGQAMAARLIGAGHRVVAYNRTPEKLQDLVRAGARAAASIAEAASGTQMTITMLADDAALGAVAQSAAGLLDSLPAGGIHVAMGTHDVAVVRDLARRHAERGQFMVAAPVLGRPDAVTSGRLGIIAAGDAAALKRVGKALEDLGRRVFFAGGDPSAASAMKLANNALLACAIEAMGEAFALVRKSGVEPELFHAMITDGLFSCPAYNIYSKIIAEKSWDTVGFTVALALKDVNLALSAGSLASVPMPSTGVCRDRLLGAVAHGDRERDWAAMALDQARASGLQD